VRICKEVRLHFKFGLQDQEVLKQLAQCFGSAVYKRTHQNGNITYYWSSTSLLNAQKVFYYFQNYSLQSTKWFNFVKWQRALKLVEHGHHKTSVGLGTILKLKDQMNR
jgi:LAGLIDADG endonuclease